MKRIGLTADGCEIVVLHRDYGARIAAAMREIHALLSFDVTADLRAAVAAEQPSLSGPDTKCSECGKPFEKFGNKKTCSAACAKARIHRIGAAVNAKIAAIKREGKPAAPKADAGAKSRDKVCRQCGKTFADTSTFNNMAVCSDACRKARAAAGKVPKPAARPAPPAGGIDKPTRLEMIRRAAKRVGIKPVAVPPDSGYVQPPTDPDQD